MSFFNGDGKYNQAKGLRRKAQGDNIEEDLPCALSR